METEYYNSGNVTIWHSVISKTIIFMETKGTALRKQTEFIPIEMLAYNYLNAQKKASAVW